MQAATLVETARAAGGDLLRDAHVFDVFEDAERIGAGRVSIALRFAFQADDRTLTEAEAIEVRDRVIAALAASCGAELRG